MKLLFIIIAISLTSIGYTQIYFQNPSFEGTYPLADNPPPNWQSCDNTPDTQPGVLIFTATSDGFSYLGMIYYGAYRESVQQRLNDTLQNDTTYQFTVDLACSPLPMANIGGNLEFWLGDTICGRQQLIQTIHVIDTIWIKHTITFVPDSNYTYFMLATSAADSSDVYIIIDNLSPIYKDSVPMSVNVVKPNAQQKEGIKLYPNPAQDMLHIELKEPILGEWSLDIIDITGKVLLQKTVQNATNLLQIPTHELGGGMYFVRVYAGKKVITKPFVVLKE